MAPEVSFAIIRTVYVPGTVDKVVDLLPLYLPPDKLNVMFSSEPGPSKVAMTVSTATSSVTVTFTLTFCVWFTIGVISNALTCGTEASSKVKVCDVL